MFQLLPQRILSGARVKLIETPAAPSGAVTGGAALVPDGPNAGGPAVPLTRQFTLVGARNSARLRLTSPEISRSHAAIISSSRSFYVRDLASRTGLLVNGRVVREAELAEGDALQIGPFVYRVLLPAAKLPVSDAEIVAAAAVQVHGAAPVRIEGRSLLIGRRPNCDLSLSDSEVSSTHALIFEMDGSHHLRDLSSRTGTYLNYKRVKQQRLAIGDLIRVGRTELHYVSAAELAQLPAVTPPLVPARSRPLATTVTLPPLAATYGDETVALTAMIGAEGKPVSEGMVTFSLNRGQGTIVSLPPVELCGGVARTVLSLTSLVPGGYVVLARYDPGRATELGFLASSGTNTLIIRKAWAMLAPEDLSGVYDGTPRRVTVVTQPPGLEGVTISYGGGSEPPTDVGRYPVVVRLDHPCYRAAPASGVLVIMPQGPATIPSSPLNKKSEDPGEVQESADDRSNASPPAMVDVMPTQATAELIATASDRSAAEPVAPEAPPELPGRAEPPAPPEPPKPVNESPHAIIRDEPESRDYLSGFWGRVRCDQGSFIGGLPFESSRCSDSTTPLPTSADDLPVEAERKTTVVRGVVPNRRRKSPPKADDDSKHSKSSKGLFKRFFRP